jgi:predicted NBD/HSP70 family sugar kinase
MKTTVGSVPSDVKEKNRDIILNQFRGSGPLTISEISAQTGISRQTVKHCLEYFQACNILSACGKKESTELGGKRPVQFELNSGLKFASVLLHHRGVTINITDFNGSRLFTWNSRDMEISSLDALWKMITKGVAKADPSLVEKVILVCFSVPLGFDSKGGLTVHTPFPHWPASDVGRSLKYPLASLFKKARRILLVPDAIVAGNALFTDGNSELSTADTATFYCSDGIGGSFFHHGTSARQFPDGPMFNFGHIIVEPSDPQTCSCGTHGCLESMVNRHRMKQRLLQQEKKYKKSCLAAKSVEDITFKDIFEGSAQGDSFCQAESIYYARMFAVAIRSVYITLAPKYIVFQGDFGSADPIFCEELKKQVLTYQYITEETEITFFYDEKDLTEEETIGARRIMIDDFFNNFRAYTADAE